VVAQIHADDEPLKADFRLKTARGIPFDGHLRMCVADARSPLSRAVLTVSDISWRIKAEEERLEKEKLHGVLEMAGAVCHEMNQPLQALYLLVDSLKESGQVDGGDVTDMSENLKKIRDITSKLMRVTRYRTKEYINGKMIIDIDGAVENP